MNYDFSSIDNTSFPTREELAEVEGVEFTPEDFAAAGDVYKMSVVCGMAIKCRNDDSQRQSVAEASNGGKEAFVPVETVLTALSVSLSDALIPAVLPMLMRDPQEALRFMLENGLKVGLVSGYGMASAEMPLTGWTYPLPEDIAQIPPQNLPSQEHRARHIAQQRDECCVCHRCTVARETLERITAVGVGATFQKIGGLSTIAIDEKTVKTAEQRRQVDEIMADVGVKIEAGRANTEDVATGLYL